jgi:hypothetical protein
MVEQSTSEYGSDSDKAGRYPSGKDQIGGDLFIPLAKARDKSNMMDSVCMDHPDVLVV